MTRRNKVFNNIFIYRTLLNSNALMCILVNYVYIDVHTMMHHIQNTQDGQSQYDLLDLDQICLLDHTNSTDTYMHVGS